MPDISMCANGDCPKRWSCYRHEKSGAKPSSWQSWGSFSPNEETGECIAYWPLPSQPAEKG